MFHSGNQILTRGLPTPEGPRFADRLFRFGVQELPPAPRLLSIPDRQVGRSEFIALDADQAAWMANVGKTWFREVWECSWEFHDDAAFEAFRAALEPLRTSEPAPPPKRARTRRR